MDETYISFYLKSYKVHVFVASLRGIGCPLRICFLFDKAGDTLLMVPYAKRDFKSHRVPSHVYSGYKCFEISSMQLCRLLANRHGWDMSRSYRVPGYITHKQDAAVFDLTKAELINPQ